MSSILLMKDHGNSKKGDVVSVPFIVGKTLVANGTGKYPAQKEQPAPKPVAEDPELARLRKIVAEQQKQIDDLTSPPAPAVTPPMATTGKK